MDREIITQKLESLRRSVHRIASSCPHEIEELQSSLDAQDIVTLNLTRAVQLAVDIGAHIVAQAEQTAPATMGETFDALQALGVIDAPLAQRLKKAVGFRNIAVHNYEAINWAIVFEIVRERLGDFSALARAVDRWMNTEDAGPAADPRAAPR